MFIIVLHQQNRISPEFSTLKSIIYNINGWRVEFVSALVNRSDDKIQVFIVRHLTKAISRNLNPSAFHVRELPSKIENLADCLFLIISFLILVFPPRIESSLHVCIA